MELWLVRFGLRGYKYWVGKELHRLWRKSVLRSGLLDMISAESLTPARICKCVTSLSILMYVFDRNPLFALLRAIVFWSYYYTIP